MTPYDNGFSAEPPTKAYTPPTLEELGTVGERTAGPEGGDLDTLTGGTGGFQDDAS